MSSGERLDQHKRSVTARQGLMLMGAFLVCALVAGFGGVEAQAQTHVVSKAALADLCRHSAPAGSSRVKPAQGGRVKGGGLAGGGSAYVGARNARLLEVYAIDVAPNPLDDGYDDARGVLSLGARMIFPVFDGTFSIALPTDQTFDFPIAKASLASARGALSDGTASLRLYFILSALERPSRPLCSGEGGRVRVQAEALAATLFVGKGGAGHPIEASARLAHLEFDKASAIERAYGLAAVGPDGAAPKVWIQKLLAVDDASLLQITAEHLRIDAERIFTPCYLEALARGGPKAAALTVEAQIDGSSVTQTHINVDATGFPALGKCIVESLGRLEIIGNVGQLRVRLTAFFER